ncbi:hypothetical protein ACFONN_17345 [Dyella humi]|uniref:Uncharacterized protein n=1 Tax=Dyella humi TaxID=1770547 RepID=A0ABW8IFQ3_9GAMM
MTLRSRKGLLPAPHDVSSPTREPRVRDVLPKQLEAFDDQVRIDGYTYVIEKALVMAFGNAVRLKSLLKRATSFGKAARSRLAALVNDYFLTLSPSTDDSLWQAFRDLIKHQERFSDAPWAIPEDELIEFRTILDRHAPIDPLGRLRWLFDDSGYAEMEFKDNTAFELARRNALESIKASDGTARLIELALAAPSSLSIAMSLAKIDWPIEDFACLVEQSLPMESLWSPFTSVVSSIANQKFGEAWQVRMVRYVAEATQRGDLQADAASFVFLRWPPLASTWSAIAEAGDAV